MCVAARVWRCRRASDYAMRARTRTLMTSLASQRHGTLKRSSSSIAGPQHINAAYIACSSISLLSLSSFLGSRSIVFKYSRVLSPSAVLYYCCHSSLSICYHIHPQSSPHFISHFIILASWDNCSTRLMLGTFTHPASLPVYHTLYSHLTLSRTRTTCTHIHISPHTSSNVKSYI